MDKQVAADYRRLGRSLMRDEIAAFLTTRRRVVIGLVAGILVTGSLVLGTLWAAEEPLDWWQHVSLPVGALGAAVLIAGGWLSVTRRRTRPNAPRPTFVESGELDRVSDSSGRLTVTPDRAESVSRLARWEEPRAVSRTITFGWVTAALVVLSVAALLGLGARTSLNSVITLVFIAVNSYLPFWVLPMAIGRLRTACDQADALLAEHPGASRGAPPSDRGDGGPSVHST